LQINERDFFWPFYANESNYIWVEKSCATIVLKVQLE
jgi:hypothetical protein